MHWHQLHHMQTICISPQIDNHNKTSLFNFYMLDALLDAQTNSVKATPQKIATNTGNKICFHFANMQYAL